MSVRTDTGLSGRHIGRYVLEDLVAENAGCALWRATDPLLQRPVGVRLVLLDDPRIDDLRHAAQRAAGVHDRRIVRVLDVIEEQGYLAIITEWVTGEVWSDLLEERWSPQESALVALEVGKALESAHRAGAWHGRIRPDSVMITDSREVRLRGLGVEAALWGVEPPGDPETADIHGVGAILYAGLTSRWPSRSRATTDGLRPAHLVDGSTALPGSVVPDIPPSLDTVVARSLTTVEAPAEGRYSSVGECVQALDRAYGTLRGDADDAGEGTDSATDRLVGRLSTVAVIVLAVAGLVLLAWQLLANQVGQPDAAEEGQTVVRPLPQLDTPLPEAPFAVVKTTPFDPFGDGTEGVGTAAKAVDGDRDTAWYTDSYAGADLNGKGGAGLILDLGAVRPVRAVDLKLVGTGTDFQILTAKKRPTKLGDFRRAVDVTAAGDAIAVRLPGTRKARFVMVWLTQLPFNGSSYVGGLREVKVVG